MSAYPQLRPGLVPVEAQGLHYRRVAEAEQKSRVVATIDVLAESPRRHREHILVFPIESMVANDRVAGAFHQMIVRATDASPRLGLLARTQQLHVAGDC